MPHSGSLSTIVLGLFLACPVLAGQPEDEALLLGARSNPDGPGLVEFFRLRSIKSEADEKKIEALIERLSSARFREREKATNELIAIGRRARPFLTRVGMDKDIEVRRRVADCLAAIESANSIDLELAALRLLRIRKPEGACPVLLQYLPAVSDSAVEEQLFETLTALAIRDGKADAALLDALKDKDPSRRGAAVVLIAHGGNASQKEQVRQLLKTEAEPLVRLRAGQGMLAARNKAGVAILLPLLTEAPRDIALQAREVLLSIGDAALPTREVGNGKAARQQCRDEWERWWDMRQAKLDLSKIEIDLPWLNQNAPARSVVLRWMKAIDNADKEELKRTMDAPFNLAGAIVLQSREQIEEIFIGPLQAAREKPKFDFTPPRIVELKDYLAKGPGGRTKEFLETIPAPERRIVLVSGTERTTKKVESAYVFVRVKTGQARVVGLAQSPEEEKKNPPR